MKTLPASAKFKYSWRKYQQRVLDELDSHLTDQHLHVIAPPGSGKTVLGLEVVVRLNKPALILAPTLAIRNQWIVRFCELFLQQTECPEWISSDIRNPRFLTVSTYQALHAACAGEYVDPDNDEEDEETDGSSAPSLLSKANIEVIADSLKKNGIETIVVDEAHHLKNEWWATLTEIKQRLETKTVALTATPPYDVSPAEWQRYIEFAGPVDAEISVPELMLEGDLCPHQDLVFFTHPLQEEEAKINQFRSESEKLFQQISSDKVIVEAISQHVIWLAPMQQLDWIYTNLSYYSACLIFMKANGHEVSPVHTEVIGELDLSVPPLDHHWLEILLDFYLFKNRDHFKKYSEHRLTIEQKLKRAGVLEKRVISFIENRRLSSMLTSSVSKLHAISEIVTHEHAQLGTALRMVILCDFIRKEYLSTAEANAYQLNKLGVIPVFEHLTRNKAAGKLIAALTGSLIILPTTALASFASVSSEYAITGVVAEPLAYDNDYVVITPGGKLQNVMIHIVTTVFQMGEIRVIVGTRSLLGEGWDAPSINSLVLASFVGSFVLSNQMRGRAIRTEKNNPFKTANIWHLVCLDSTATDGGADLNILKRRFKAFVGVSLQGEAIIANGIGRLCMPGNIYIADKYVDVNTTMFGHAKERPGLAERWDAALRSGVQLVEEIKIPFKGKRSYQQVKSFYLSKTLGYLFATLTFAVGEYFTVVGQNLGRLARSLRGPGELSTLITLIVGLAIILFGRKTYQALRLFLKYRDIGKDVHRIGEALLHSLIHAGYIKTRAEDLHVETQTDIMGGVACHLEGGTTPEKSIFMNALMEVVGLVDNPRYVIVRRHRIFGVMKQYDFHAVPEILGRNKSIAEFFANEWQQRVGQCDLIFTRTLDGRKLLLQYRLKSLAAQFEEAEVEHQSRWVR